MSNLHLLRCDKSSTRRRLGRTWRCSSSQEWSTRNVCCTAADIQCRGWHDFGRICQQRPCKCLAERFSRARLIFDIGPTSAPTCIRRRNPGIEKSGCHISAKSEGYLKELTEARIVREERSLNVWHRRPDQRILLSVLRLFLSLYPDYLTSSVIISNSVFTLYTWFSERKLLCVLFVAKTKLVPSPSIHPPIRLDTTTRLAISSGERHWARILRL